jgi:hypothetical protein
VVDTVTGWESTQGQTDDGAVESEQRVLLDAPAVAFDRAGAARLGERYWVEVQGATHGLVRSRMRGDRLQLRILGRGPVLLSFGHPALDVTTTRVACRFSIEGGLLAQRGAGELTFTQTAGERVEVRSAIRGFYPRLAAGSGRLYSAVQSRIHVAISRRYFARLAREAGS